MDKQPVKKLKAFIEKRQKKLKEFQVSLEKTDVIKCEDCKKQIFIEGAFSGCICFGSDRNNKIFIKKNENGFSMRFPKSWDTENIQMLLETLRNKNKNSEQI